MNAKENTPILVTGAHRSGTTWVGKMLAASGEAAYISEPMNVWHRPGVMQAPIRYWYTYICDRNEGLYLPALRQTLRFHYHLWAEAKSLRSVKDFLRMLRDGSTFLGGKVFAKRALLKDPFAVFSAPWFSDRLGCQVVITVRHPAAFASSLKSLDWPFDFGDLLAQQLLIQNLLATDKEEIEKACQEPGDVVARSALLWRLIYQVVARYRDEFPQFQIVRHEDLSADPQAGFQSLYASLGLTFTSRARRTIIKASSPDNPAERSSSRIHAVRLDSQANLENWKRRLTLEEIARLQRLTGEVASEFYSEGEWG